MDKLYLTKIKPNLSAVRECRQSGGTAGEVCSLLSVSPPTLRKYLRLEGRGDVTITGLAREFALLSEV